MKGAMYGIASEGWPVVLALAAMAGLLFVSVGVLAAVLPLVLLVLAILKFRDPPRTVPADPLGVISPVDGEITAIDRRARGVRVCLRIQPFGAYLLRSPTEGKVLESGRERGGHGMRIRTDEGEDILLRLYGPHWLPPAAGIGYGQRVGQGQRCGVVRAASVAEVWLPADAALNVKVGQKVAAGETVIGHFATEAVSGARAASA